MKRNYSFFNIIVLLILVMSLPIILWLISFSFFSGYICASLLLLSLVMVFKVNPAKVLILYIVFFFIINISLIPSSLSEYNKRRNALFTTVKNGKELNFSEKYSIYGLNLVMSILGYPFYPEASTETFLLILKAPNNSRTFKDNFFLASKRVQSAISENYKNNVRKIKWNISDYSFGNKESRYALALNPCSLTIDNNNKYTLKVRIEYPENSEVILFEKPFKIVVEEGLFHYLQKSGWLHPYDAIWIHEEKVK